MVNGLYVKKMARMVSFIMFMLYLPHFKKLFKINFCVLAQCFSVFRACSMYPCAVYTCSIHGSARPAGGSRCIILSVLSSLSSVCLVLREFGILSQMADVQRLIPL
jgi:hypothetical protein